MSEQYSLGVQVRFRSQNIPTSSSRQEPSKHRQQMVSQFWGFCRAWLLHLSGCIGLEYGETNPSANMMDIRLTTLFELNDYLDDIGSFGNAVHPNTFVMLADCISKSTTWLLCFSRWHVKRWPIQRRRNTLSSELCFTTFAGGWDMNDLNWPDIIPAGPRQFKPRRVPNFRLCIRGFKWERQCSLPSCELHIRSKSNFEEQKPFRKVGFVVAWRVFLNKTPK